MQTMLQAYQESCALLENRIITLRQRMKNPALTKQEMDDLERRRRLLRVEMREIEHVMEMICAYLAAASPKKEENLSCA